MKTRYSNQLLAKLASLWMVMTLWWVAASGALAQGADMLPLTDLQMVASSTDSPPPASADWQPTTLPYFRSYRDTPALPDFLWFRFSLPRTVDDTTLALFTARHMQNLDIYVNGVKLHSERALDPYYFGWNTPLLVELQPATLGRERNEVMLGLRKSIGSTYLNNVTVAAYPAALRLYQRATLLQVQTALSSLITCLVLGALTLGLWLTRRQFVEYLYYTSSCLAWAVVMLYMVLPTPPWPDLHSWNVLSYLCMNLAGLALLAFIARMLKFRAKPWLWSLLAVQLGGHGLVLMLQPLHGYPLALGLNVVTLLALLYAGGKVVWLLRHQPSTNAWWIAGALAALALFAGFDLVRYVLALRSGSGFGYATVTQFSFLVTLVIVFAHLISRYWRAQQASERMNAELVQRVHAATLELEAHLQLRHQQELVTQAQLEREKIYRDLHDDVGAKLTSLLHVTDSSKQRQLARAALESLRETVHHARHQDQSLLECLQQCADELQVRLLAAGLAVQVSIAPTLPDRPLLAHESYHLTRVMRELTNNILHHAHASHVSLHVELDSQRRCVLFLHDDGCGFQPHPTAGSALRGIRERVRELNGTVEWRSAAGEGCTVVLRMKSTI